ncbi:MAG: hypothetical protein KGI06_04190 [Candidatus Micrarchaeota archaeon]|nr:hypothetical protein [Candidatus Micrarchaeota archaeon]
MAYGVIKIIMDNRERNGTLLEALESAGIEIELRTLHVGDYVVSDRVCIERKTVSDFESSIMNGRLFEQIKRLKESYEMPMLVLEGDAEYFKLKSSVINGAIASLYIDYGIMVMHTQDAKDTALMLASMARHEQLDHERHPSLKGGARSFTESQFQERVIGNIPGIGPKLARSLLTHFRSIRGIANADESELMKVEKIGRKKAHLIRSTLNGRYENDEDSDAEP